jgi:hypothetical protein
MNEELIERRVEKLVDHLDARYMSGEVTTEEYREQMDAINAWADSKYAEVTP